MFLPLLMSLYLEVELHSFVPLAALSKPRSHKAPQKVIVYNFVGVFYIVFLFRKVHVMIRMHL